MVPKEPVLGFSREAIGEVTAWRNWVLLKSISEAGEYGRPCSGNALGG